jgi:hypothetical protein
MNETTECTESVEGCALFAFKLGELCGLCGYFQGMV